MFHQEKIRLTGAEQSGYVKMSWKFIVLRNFSEGFKSFRRRLRLTLLISFDWSFNDIFTFWSLNKVGSCLELDHAIVRLLIWFFHRCMPQLLFLHTPRFLPTCLRQNFRFFQGSTYTHPNIHGMNWDGRALKHQLFWRHVSQTCFSDFFRMYNFAVHLQGSAG